MAKLNTFLKLVKKVFVPCFFCIISDNLLIATELKLATNHYVQYNIFATVIKLF